MSTEETIVDQVSEDLDTFESQLYGRTNDSPEQASSEEVQGLETDSDAQEEDTHADEVDTLDTDDDESSNEAEPQKKTRYQERIDQLTSRARNAERDYNELYARFEALESKVKPAKQTEAPAETPKTSETAPPDFDEKLPTGEYKYPDGATDPAYIRDLTNYHYDQRAQQDAATRAKATEDATYQAQQDARQAAWNEKLVPAQERYPDFQERGQSMIESLGEIDQALGKYLTDTIMELDNGTDVFYYLSTNPQEAKAIVDSGAVKATIALGRIDAMFGSTGKPATVKTTNAPPPPPTNRGSGGAVTRVSEDTDDLEAFGRALYRKKGK